MRFTQRIMLIPALAGLAFVIVFALVFRNVYHTSHLIRTLQIDFFTALQLTHEMEQEITGLRYTLSQALTVGDPEAVEETEAMATRFYSLLDRGLAIPTIDADHLSVLRRQFETYYTKARRLTPLLMAQDGLETADEGFWRDVEIMNRAYDGLLEQLADLAGRQEQRMLDAFEESADRVRTMNRFTTVLALACVGGLVLLAVGANLSVARPLRKLREAAFAIAKGDLEQPLDYRSRDDLGELAESFREMQRALVAEFARREEAEAALRESQQRLALALDAANDGIWDIDWDAGTFYTSDRWAQMLGYDADEKPTTVEGMMSLFEPVAGAVSDAEFQRRARAGEDFQIEGRMQRKDGGKAWVEIKGRTVAWNEAGQAARMVGTISDITARKDAEFELRQAQQQLLEAAHGAGMAEIATSVLHNVGNVLNTAATSAGVMRRTLEQSRLGTLHKVADLVAEKAAAPDGLARWLAEDPQGRELPRFLAELTAVLDKESARQRDEIDQLVRNLEHIKEIIAVQQSYAGVSGVREKLPARELVEDAVQLFGTSFSRHNIAFAIKQAGALPPLLVEKNRALQILINLLKNARDAVRESRNEERRITVSLARGGVGAIAITVRDNGVGIAPEMLPKVFGYGFTTKRDGHGYGLHGSANSAREMGGSLTVASDGTDRGAVFTLTLPSVESEVET